MNAAWSRVVLCVALVLGSLSLQVTPVAAGDDPTMAAAALAEAASKSYADSDWAAAVAQYQRIVDGDPSQGQAWFRLGRAHQEQGQHDRAVQALTEAVERGFAAGWAEFYLGRSLIARGDVAAGLDRLDEAAGKGFASLPTVEGDALLEKVVTSERYAAFLAQVRNNAEPCAASEIHRQFDFWIGEWEVSSGGRKAGDNRIERILNGCALRETWRSVQGGSGTSYNYYDPVSKQWRQLWLDASGGHIAYAGGRQGTSMVFEGVNVNLDGTSERSKMSFTPQSDGRVRQVIEQSKDDGKTWYVWFDGMYAPVK